MNQPRHFTVSSLALLAAGLFLALPAHAQTSPFILNGASTSNTTVVTASGSSDVVTTSNGTFNPSSAFSDTGGNTTVTIGASTTIVVTSGNQAISIESGSVTNSGQVTTGGSNTAIVILSTPASVTNNAGASLTGGRDGVAIQAGGTVNNYGTITGTNTDGVFALTGSATVNNYAGGTIQGNDNGVDIEEGGSVTNGGTINGNSTGILVLHASGTVMNTGIITGTGQAAVALDEGGSVTNSGTISSSNGVAILALANSSTVTNSAGGTISGHSDAIDFNAGGSVINSGAITSSDETGILITGGTGSVTNNAGATISGPNNAITLDDGGTVINSGTITTTNGTAILLNGISSVTNNAGAYIQGVNVSVDLNDGGTLYNAGQIVCTNPSSFAVRIGGAGGTITNAAGGVITSSNDAVEVNAGSTTINNYGTVTSANRFAIFGGTGNTLNNYGTLTTMEGLNGANPAYNAVFMTSGTFTNIGGIVNAPSLYYAVQFSGSNNTANIGNFSRFLGSTAADLFGGGGANEVLNFTFFGGTVGTPTGTPADGSLTAQGFTYTYQDFTSVNVSASTTIAALGTTPNQVATGQGLDNAINTAGAQGASPAGLEQIINSLENIYDANPGAVGYALSQLSPEKFGTFTSATAFNNASFDTLATDSYLNSQRFGPNGTFVGGNGNIDASGMTIDDPNYDPQLSGIHSRLLAWNPAPVSNGLLSDVADPVLAGTQMQDSKDMKEISEVSKTPWNVFVRGNVVLAQGFSQADVPHFDDNSEGVTVGGDYRFTPNFLLGVMGSYEHTDATLDNFGSSATVDSYSPGLYASYADHGWYANFSGDYVHNAYTQSRVIAFLGQTANSAPEGDEGVVNLDGGYEFHDGNLTYGPLAGLQYTHLTVNGYSESGSAADLTVNEDDSDSLRSRLGGRVSDLFTCCGGVTITPHLDASWQHEFLDQSRGITSQFTGFGGGSFSVNTPNPSRDSALIDAGVDADLNRTVTVFLDYQTQVGADNYFGQSVQAGVKIGF